MATYAIGDIQGCHASLLGLLERIAFDPERDRLWLTGDLVNRGPASLHVLRWARDLGPLATVVLGNHDLHLLRVDAGLATQRGSDTLDDVLAAPDRGELLDWLAARPLVHRESIAGRPRLMLHAGLHPSWTADTALALGRQYAAALCDDRHAALASLDTPDAEAWVPTRTGPARHAAVVAWLTRVRTCTRDGRPCSRHKGPPDDAPPGCEPWFEVAPRAWADHQVICGHWAALGLHVTGSVAALDSGCVWGKALSALRLEDGAVFSEPAREGR